MIFSDKKIEDNLRVIINKINEIFQREQKDISILTENFVKLDERIKLIENKAQEIARLDNEIKIYKNKFNELKNSFIELGSLVSEIDIDLSNMNEKNRPQFEEPPKPEPIKRFNPNIQIVKQRGRPRKIITFPDEEVKEGEDILPGEIKGYCPHCKEEKKMIGADIKETEYGPMWKGRCVSCNAEINKKKQT